MRLWHHALIPKLPRAQILGQHREICALRGNGWGKKHATVDYVFAHPFEWLVAYHYLVINEMGARGYKVDKSWFGVSYRGKLCDEWKDIATEIIYLKHLSLPDSIYPEHNDAYLQECLDNLKGKGVEID
jgi:uncharacterized protein (TIGR02328 family)